MAKRNQQRRDANARLVQRDAELALVGSVLLRPAVLGELTVRPAEFADPGCRLLMGVIVDLRRQGRAIDVRLVSAEARARWRGPHQELHLLLIEAEEKVTTSAHAWHYAELVADAAHRRRLVDAAREIEHLARHAGNASDASWKLQAHALLDRVRRQPE